MLTTDIAYHSRRFAFPGSMNGCRWKSLTILQWTFFHHSRSGPFSVVLRAAKKNAIIFTVIFATEITSNTKWFSAIKSHECERALAPSRRNAHNCRIQLRANQPPPSPTFWRCKQSYLISIKRALENASKFHSATGFSALPSARHTYTLFGSRCHFLLPKSIAFNSFASCRSFRRISARVRLFSLVFLPRPVECLMLRYVAQSFRLHSQFNWKLFFLPENRLHAKHWLSRSRVPFVCYSSPYKRK